MKRPDGFDQQLEAEERVARPPRKPMRKPGGRRGDGPATAPAAPGAPARATSAAPSVTGPGTPSRPADPAFESSSSPVLTSSSSSLSAAPTESGSPEESLSTMTRPLAPGSHPSTDARSATASGPFSPRAAGSGRVTRKARSSGGERPAAVALDKKAGRVLARAARARRHYERAEVRRFTRSRRRRRVTWAIVGGLVVTMLALVAVAVYSPLLALQTIRIEGAARVPADDILDAVDGQLGTPLALLDFGRIEGEIADFPLIRSYVTETVPPDTLVIHISERQPIGALADAAGFTLVDAAGVVVERVQERAPGIALIEVGGAGTDSAAFDGAVQVLLALPESVRARLDTITATTTDDVRLTLIDQGPAIVWGSADDSDYKARVLEDALAQDFSNASEINVSAPGQLTYR